MWRILSGVWMGWALGSNDAANLFGTGVAAKIIKYRTATILIAIFVVIGSVLEGPKAMGTLVKLVNLSQNLNMAFIVSLSAAISVTVMTYLGIPISTSQAVVGALLGGAIILGNIDTGKLIKIGICWVGTPVGAAIIAYIIYSLLDLISKKFIKNVVFFNKFVKISTIIAGSYGAYSLGANNVANVTAVYVGAGMLSPFMASLVGGIAIALGALTYSKNVMTTVGKKITVIGPLGALVAEVSHSITLHIYTQIGVPVSSSQAIVGAVIGTGIVKGIREVSYKKVVHIFMGWIFTPLSACIVSLILIKIFEYFGFKIFI